ncbi:homoserine O-succinyltransferase [Francisella orientalis str. Toba 04]|nr:homoserine O-succinyltransferase [Francisella orientalis str. Toba 04]AHB99101.1 hypothetical protein M973_03010 [Francisella orientalis LADL 07-285A]
MEYTDVIIASAIDGLDYLADKKYDIIYMFNHLEYTQDTLEAEYLRDKATTNNIDKPYNYMTAKIILIIHGKMIERLFILIGWILSNIISS